MHASVATALFVTVLAGPAVADRAAEPNAPSTAPTDYGPQVKALFRVGACGSDELIPARFSTKAVAAHCKEMAHIYAAYKEAWGDKAESFIAGLRPPDAPKTVVYPFGGGDLSSALVVFPDATELTTISLEAAGDVRAIDTINNAMLVTDLDVIGHDIQRLYYAAHSTTQSLQQASHSRIPGTLMMALAGLAVHGMEPVALRYFDINADGTLRYLSNAELDARAAAFEAGNKGKKKPKKVTHYWYEQESPFSNVEIQFRPHGDASAPVRTYRHIVANLDDPHMTEDGRVLEHLKRKGKVSVMTKAASFLLWFDDFTQIRNYLLANIAWMVSDASGIPPSYAGPAGYEQITYGEFAGPYFIQDEKNTRAEFVKMWKIQPKRPLPFRFGYPDSEKHNHLMITRPKSATAP